MPTCDVGLSVVRMPERCLSDDSRVIMRPFLPGGDDRTKRIIQRIMALTVGEVRTELAAVVGNFGTRHKNMEEAFAENFELVAHLLEDGADVSPERRMLMGSYFTMEYSIESAALFNPSIVPHPDQSGLPAGSLRFIMSLRATGEGHVSSIVFRTGAIHASREIALDSVSPFVERAKTVRDRLYDKNTFYLKLIEMGGYRPEAGPVFDALPEQFTFRELEQAIKKAAKGNSKSKAYRESADDMRWLARSNYHLAYPHHLAASEVVIFPTSENESRGIEDARFVRFIDDDGGAEYYGTYTAYNGVRILPQLLETTDFTHFRITTLNGRYVQNKGLALFPRKIDGWYMMISRLDGENLFIMRSENIRFWNEAMRIAEPTFPWEFVQIGNCGSPIETDRGWLVLTHGVGPMRRYCIGAMLLDRDDPKKVLGQLREPLIAPNENEREGYVPNVVYSCGALVHGGRLIIPYGISDSATTFATIELESLLNELAR